MNNLKIEKHLIKSRELLPKRLAESLISHVKIGRVAIVADDPQILMQVTKQSWDELREAAGLSTRFTATVPQDFLDAGVTFATLEDFLRMPPSCQVLYITYSIEKQSLYMLTSWMPPRSLVVFYDD